MKNKEDLINTRLEFSRTKSFGKNTRAYLTNIFNKKPAQKRGHVVIESIDLVRINGSELAVYGFIHNTTNRTLYMKNPIIILYNNNEMICSKTQLNGRDIGNLSPFSSKPWIFIFILDDSCSFYFKSHGSYMVGFEKKYIQHKQID